MVALLLALKHPDVNIVGISVVAGNTTLNYMAANIIRIFNLIEHKNPNFIRPPVYRGAENPIMGNFRKINRTGFHGGDGLGDCPEATPKRLPEAVATQIFEKDENHEIVSAHDGMISAAKKYQNLEIVTLGPVTNLALAVKVFSNLPKSIGKLHIMGGNHLGMGNDSNTAEYNFLCDPEAAYIVLEEFGNVLGLNLMIGTWEFSWKNKMGQFLNFDALKKKISPEFHEFFEKTVACRLLTPRVDAFKPIVSIPNTKDENEILKDLKKEAYSQREIEERSKGIICDAQLMACAIDPSLVTQMEDRFTVSVEYCGHLTRGMMILHRSLNAHQKWDLDDIQGRRPVSIIHETDVKRMAEMISMAFEV